MTKPSGGPAFPRPLSRGDDYAAWEQDGMSLREYFAGQALAGILVNPGTAKQPGNSELLASTTYAIADAMLAEREK